MDSRLVLVTGITGFVGGAVAARLVAEGHRVAAIVRAESEEHAARRVARSLARFSIQATSIEVIVGDLLSDATWDDPSYDEVTDVVHAAACTSFASTREVWLANVEGTRKLANRMRAAHALRRFLHVSTAYCCGARPSPIVHEDDAPRTDHGHVNEYARSKAAAELLLASMDWKDRLVVARPSIVVGHTELGVGPSTSLFWYYRALASLGCGPFLQEGIDLLEDVRAIAWKYQRAGLEVRVADTRERVVTVLPEPSTGWWSFMADQLHRRFALQRRWDGSYGHRVPIPPEPSHG